MNLKVRFHEAMGKMKISNRTPLVVSAKSAWIGGLGGFITIAVLMGLTFWFEQAWIMAPFGASCVLAFGLWEAPLSQPRNLLGGHLLSTFIGLVMLELLGDSVWSAAAAVGLAIACMQLTKTTHPPAGADPLVVILGGASWSYLLTPALTGSLVIIVLAVLFHNLIRDRRYPTFWW